MDLAKSSRFKDAVWYSGTKIVPCLVGGAGGIGSWLTLLLARAGFEPYVFDFDLLEEHNLGGQLFSKKSIGQSKVSALKELVFDFTGKSIQIFNEKYERESLSNHYVFAGFDNMQARKDMFYAWKDFVTESQKGQSYSLVLTNAGTSKLAVVKLLKEELNLGLKEAKDLADNAPILLMEDSFSKKPLRELQAKLASFGAESQLLEPILSENEENSIKPIFIDGRLLMEQLTIFCVTPENASEYEQYLFDDSEVPDGPCTLKQTSHSAAMIASFMVAFFTNHITNEREKDSVRNVPFHWEYFIPVNYVST